MSAHKELDWIIERAPFTKAVRRAQDLSINFYYIADTGMSELMDACHSVFYAGLVDVDMKHYGCVQEM